MTTDPIKVSAEEIEQLRSQLADNSEALADLDVIERSRGELERASRVLARRAGVEEVRAGESWQLAVQKARKIVCDDKFKKGLAPGLIGGLIGAFTSSGSPVLAAVATPVSIYVSQVTIDAFCKPPKSTSEDDEDPS